MGIIAQSWPPDIILKWLMLDQQFFQIFVSQADLLKAFATALSTGKAKSGQPII